MEVSRRPTLAIISDLQPVAGQQLFTIDRIPVEASLSVLGARPLGVFPDQRANSYEDVLREADGIFLRGGLSNVHPSCYGRGEGWASGPFDRARDAFVLPLVPLILERGIPLLATCRGFHELNVALGGTLRQERDDLPEHQKHGTPKSASTEDERYRIRQDVRVVAGGALHAILKTETARVNSLHSQLIDKLAPDLRIEATAQDGTIEAATPRHGAGFALGVVFHPEYWGERDETSSAILGAFARAMHHYAGARGGRGHI